MRIDQNKKFYVVLYNIRSLYNVGSIFRTADALSVTKIYLGGITGTPLKNKQKIHKTALGAEDNVKWSYKKRLKPLIEKLKKEKIKVIALEQSLKAKPYFNFKPHFPLALILGNEIKGISSSLLKIADFHIFIPMFGVKESLNVAVAFGIVGYYFNQFRIKG